MLESWVLYVIIFGCYPAIVWAGLSFKTVVSGVPEQVVLDIGETHHLVEQIAEHHKIGDWADWGEAPEVEVRDKLDAIDGGIDAVLRELSEVKSDIEGLAKPAPKRRATRKRTTKSTAKRTTKKAGAK